MTFFDEHIFDIVYGSRSCWIPRLMQLGMQSVKICRISEEKMGLCTEKGIFLFIRI